MANTVPILNFTNTFGDLLSQQNRAAVELNTLGANNYTKDSGTLILNGAGTGLSVTGAAILGSTIVANTSSLIGDVTALANVFINGAGFALDVANNANIRKNTITDTLLANTIIRTTTVNASGNVFANDITSNNSIRAVSVVSSGNTTVNALRSNTSILGASLNITGQALTNALQANTSIESSTLIVSNLGTVNALQSNTSVNTAIVTATNTIIGNNIQANTGLSSTTLSVSGLSSVGSLQANNSVNTATATITGTTFTDALQANSSVNTATISVTGTGFVNLLQANSSVNTAIITASNSITGQNIRANTGLSSNTIVANTIVANTSVTVPILTVTSRLDANSAPIAFFDNIQTLGQVSVGGNFVINGTTVYSTNTFTLNAGSAVGQISSFNVNRGSSGANASIRWNETQDYWDIIDVNNPSSYSKILTANLISSSLTSTSTDTFASSLAANTLNNALQANVVSLQSQIASDVSSISGVNATQNTNITALNNYSVTAFNRANTSSNTFFGTTGSASANAGIISITSTNGITVVGSSNTLTINTPQDLRITAAPTFNDLTLTNALPITQGGTGATSSGAALTNLLPTASGVPAGFVLATNGPGTYYWAAGGTGGGGGAVPGTTIQSTRLTYTGNGTTTVYTAPTYIPGASQLRVYFDGVRQFPSAYTETNATTVTFGTAPSTGVIIFIEVDGYINNPYFANNITFTSPFGSIVSTANTIQLAIQDLETRKAALSAASFTGSVTGVTVDTNASNTVFATTAFVKNSLNNSNTYTHSISGNAGTVTNGVYTTGNQTIGGTKTFSSQITGSISGNAGTVTNGVYTSGDQTIGGTKTFSSQITGSISGNAGTATLATKASTLSQGGGNGTAMTFNWSGQGGQPTWLWGSNDGTSHFVYNPSNFSVNFATSATTATNLSGGSVTGTTGTFTGSVTVSTNNASGGGLILADDGDIVDLNTGYCAMRFSSGVQIYSGNRTGSAVMTLGSNGQVTASQFNGSGAGLTGTAPSLSVNYAINAGIASTALNTSSFQGKSKLGLGITGEVWNDVTGSRSQGVTYTNNRSYPIQVQGNFGCNQGGQGQIYIDGVLISYWQAQFNGCGGFSVNMPCIVPAGSTYVLAAMNGSARGWYELY